MSRGDVLDIGRAVLSRSASEIRTRESIAQVAAMAGGAVALVVAPFVFHPAGTPLSGLTSVATVTSLLVAVLGGSAFASAYVRVARHTARWRRRLVVWRVWDAAALTIAAAAMAAMASLAAYNVFQRMFQGLLLGRIAATLMSAVTVAACCYFLTLIAQGMSSSGVAVLLGAFLGVGGVAATLTADDPGWWQSNFSALGVRSESSASAFNFTVITAGVVLTTLGDYVADDLERWPGVTVRINRSVRVLLIGIGLALIGLGTIPVDQSRLVHDIFAVSAIVGFGGLILATPFLLRDLPRPFLLSTAVLGALIVGIVLLWKPFHVYNFTAVELLSVLVIFAWLGLLTRTVGSGPPAELDEAEVVREVGELGEAAVVREAAAVQETAVVGEAAELVPRAPVADDPPQAAVRELPASAASTRGGASGPQLAILVAAGAGLTVGAVLATLLGRRD
ncbi:MAG TPA: hypothetical protein VFK68_12405 [Propionibacteriaceae bacterium]|nr:hypothetical protein [Propionibacteriaceae bacterium]